MSSENAVNNNRFFGLSWSAAEKAGDHVYRAEFDPATKALVEVSKPWAGLGVDDLVVQVSSWIGGLNDAWVAVDARLGIPHASMTDLIGMGSRNQREVAHELITRFGTLVEFEKSVSADCDRARNRRTDTDYTTPLDMTRTPKTYGALRLVAALPETVALLPSEHQKMSSAPVKLIEVSASRFVASKWAAFLDYERKRERRDALLEVFLKERLWTCSEELREVAGSGTQGYGVAAVIAASLAEWGSKHKPEQHAERARRHILEGCIYSP